MFKKIVGMLVALSCAAAASLNVVAVDYMNDELSGIENNIILHDDNPSTTELYSKYAGLLHGDKNQPSNYAFAKSNEMMASDVLQNEVTNAGYTADAYEPNSIDSPYLLSPTINSTSSFLTEITANLGPDAEADDFYQIHTYRVKELVVMLSNIPEGDVYALYIQNKNGVSQWAVGDSNTPVVLNLGSAATEDMDTYTIAVMSSNAISEFRPNYSLLIANRYISNSLSGNFPSPVQFYNNNSYASIINMNLSSETSIPQAAIVDKIVTKGAMSATGATRTVSSRIKVSSSQTTEALFYQYGPNAYFENLSSKRLSLRSNWTFSYLPNGYYEKNITLSNGSVSFNYTYDILA